MMAGETQVVLTPQGTLAEQIRCACYGLGGFLTRTGVGTAVQEGKDVVEVDGVKYLLEKPLHADFALIFAHKADKYGNLVYHGAAQNFNSVMAGAATTTIVEVLEYSEEALNPDVAETPGVFVDYIVKRGA
jgi:acetate CoA/acetoacetate CoA-transferase alpha subunit